MDVFDSHMDGELLQIWNLLIFELCKIIGLSCGRTREKEMKWNKKIDEN